MLADSEGAFDGKLWAHIRANGARGGVCCLYVIQSHPIQSEPARTRSNPVQQEEEPNGVSSSSGGRRYWLVWSRYRDAANPLNCISLRFMLCAVLELSTVSVCLCGGNGVKRNVVGESTNLSSDLLFDGISQLAIIFLRLNNSNKNSNFEKYKKTVK